MVSRYLSSNNMMEIVQKFQVNAHSQFLLKIGFTSEIPVPHDRFSVLTK